MKTGRSLLLIALMIALLAGCAPSAEQQRESLLAHGLRCEVRLVCDLGETAAVYTLEAALGETVTLRLLEPEPLKGLTATVTGKELTLCYEEAMFACELPNDSVYAPIMVLPAAWAAIQDGVQVRSEGTEEGVLVTFSRFEGEEEYLFNCLLGDEERPLRRITMEKNGRKLASVEVLRTL